jgi:hypothetical protein
LLLIVAATGPALGPSTARFTEVEPPPIGIVYTTADTGKRRMS